MKSLERPKVDFNGDKAIITTDWKTEMAVKVRPDADDELLVKWKMDLSEAYQLKYISNIWNKCTSKEHNRFLKTAKLSIVLTLLIQRMTQYSIHKGNS